MATTRDEAAEGTRRDRGGPGAEDATEAIVARLAARLRLADDSQDAGLNDQVARDRACRAVWVEAAATGFEVERRVRNALEAGAGKTDASGVRR